MAEEQDVREAQEEIVAEGAEDAGRDAESAAVVEAAKPVTPSREVEQRPSVEEEVAAMPRVGRDPYLVRDERMPDVYSTVREPESTPAPLDANGERAAKMPGYAALILGEWDKHPERREAAVKAFGEDKVKGWEEASEEQRDVIAGLMWVRDMKEPGETETDYLVRRSRGTGKVYGTPSAMWQADRARIAPVVKKSAETAEADAKYWRGYVLEKEEEDPTAGEEARGRMPEEERAKIERARKWVKTYLRTIDKSDIEEALHRVDQLREPLYQAMTEDPEVGAYIIQALNDWAEEVKESNAVGIGDEFVVAVGKKIQDWMDAGGETYNAARLQEIENRIVFWEGDRQRAEEAIREEGEDARIMTSAPTVMGGANGAEFGEWKSARAVIAENEKKIAEGKKEVEELERQREEWERQTAARGNLRDAVNKAIEISDTEGWWKGVGRVVAQAAGETSVYLAGTAAGTVAGGPIVGMIAGTADQMVGASTETYDSLIAAGYTPEQARNRAIISGAIESAVEALPFSVVGGIGTRASLRILGRMRGPVGSLAARIANFGERGIWQGMTVEGIGGFMEEAVLEPVTGGVGEWAAQKFFDTTGLPYTKPPEDYFSELHTIWGDSKQVVGMAIFCGMLGGLSFRGTAAQAREFAVNKERLEAVGLTREQVERVLAEGDEGKRMARASEFYNKNWQEDAAGTAARAAAANKKYAAAGSALFFTGQGGSAQYNGVTAEGQLNAAMGRAWSAGVRAGILPEVKRNGDGTYTVTQVSRDGKRAEMRMDAAQADSYLKGVMGRWEERERERRRKGLKKEEAEKVKVDLRAELMRAVQQEAGQAAVEQVEKKAGETGISIEDVTKQLPADIAARIKAHGMLTHTDAADIAAWAQGRIDELTGQGLTEKEARSQRASATASGHVLTLGDWASFYDNFTRRAGLAGLTAEQTAIPVFRLSNMGMRVKVDGREVMGQTIFTMGTGELTGHAVLEDVTESVLRQMVEGRAQQIAEETDADMGGATQQAWNELGEIVERARAEVLRVDPEAKIEEVEWENGRAVPMSVIEAMSTLAVSKYMEGAYVPGWMEEIQAVSDGLVEASSAIGTVQRAFAKVLQDEGAEGAKAVNRILEQAGIRVRNIFADARVEEQTRVEQETLAAGEEGASMGRYGNGVAAHTERTEEEEESTQGETIEEDREETKREREGQRANLVGADEEFNRAPKGMAGVFVGDACVYNAAGGYYVGEIEKGKIKMGLKQVKQGEKGKYGEIVGRELTGKFVASTAPIYIWMRKDGTLELISGRHRFAKAMEDEGVGSVMCYVFREDAEHNELWAELLDYENNLRDDQADERTAAYYVRKFPQTDEELRAKGLLRNGTVARRGIFIGRYARENLYNMWVSTDPRLPLGRATNIEEICRMTKDIKDVSRIEDIQSTAARLLGEGESWEYINGMIHMMAQDRTAELRQGLLDMGTDYTQNLERAARYIEKVVKDLEAGIKQIKDFMANKGLARGSSARKKARSAAAVGLEAGNLKYAEEKLAALIEAAEQWKMVGSYPELVSEAYMWDGETEVEKAGRICSRVEEEQDAAVEAGERARAQAEVPEGQGEMSFSAEEAEGRGMFGENGVMVAGNGFVARPGVDFSAAVEGAQHASPYLFKAFDTAHIGEGEGVQAYGWGLYFSSNWQVNKSYWEQFSGRDRKVTTNFGYSKTGKWDRDLYGELADTFVDRMGGGDEEKMHVNIKIGAMVRWGRYEEEIERAKRRLEEVKNRPMEMLEKRRSIWRAELDLALLEFLERNEVKEEKEENAVDYLVDLEVEDSELLEWGEKASEAGWWNEEVEEGLREIIRNRVLEDRGRTEEQKEWFVEDEMESMRVRDGSSFYKWLAEWLGQRKASEWLLARGVKGIRYEDGFSRKREEEKTYNYVVFDGGDVKIRKINNRGAWTSDVGGEPWERAEEVSMSVEELFHATPHDFDVFKMGRALKSGEGNQSFGAGLYLAQSKEVNKVYWDRFYKMFYVDRRGRLYRTGTKWGTGKITETKSGRVLKAGDAGEVRKYILDGEARRARMEKLREVVEKAREEAAAARAKAQPAREEAAGRIPERAAEEDRLVKKAWMEWVERVKAGEKGREKAVVKDWGALTEVGRYYEGQIPWKLLGKMKRAGIEEPPVDVERAFAAIRRVNGYKGWREARVSEAGRKWEVEAEAAEARGRKAAEEYAGLAEIEELGLEGFLPNNLRVRFDAEADEMINWDEAGTASTRKLKEAMGDVEWGMACLWCLDAARESSFYTWARGKKGKDKDTIRKAVLRAIKEGKNERERVGKIAEWLGVEGKEVRKALREGYEGEKWEGRMRGMQMYWYISQTRGGDVEASRWCVKHGIYGTKYMDGESRKHPERVVKTYNYVVFDPGRAVITHRSAHKPYSMYRTGSPNWEPSMSVEEAEGRGMFGEKGVMVAGNGFVARPGVDFSAAVEGAQHASPHLFKAFDTAHMGEGEGNQAYGWGLYFSTNWGVNRWYWSKFSSGKLSLIVNGEILAQQERRETFMRILAERYAADKKLELTEDDMLTLSYFFTELVYLSKRTYAEQIAFHEKWKEIDKEEGIDRGSYRDQRIEALNYLIDNDVKIERLRAVDYLVDLDVEEEELLPWEGKIEDKEIQGALKELLGEKYKLNDVGKEVYKKLRYNLGGQKKASKWLLAHGIKGIKYWDGSSRRKERGFYNYVIFDGGDVKIRKINNRGAWTSDVGAEQWENFSAEVEVMTDEELSSAVVGIDDRVMGILRARDAEEAMGARIAGEWAKFAKAVSLSTASGDEWRAEDGARLMGKMLGLVAATRRFLPEEYGVARGMHQMIAWAKWYAQVLESGEVKRTDMLRGDIYEKALAGMRREVEGMRGRLTPGEVEGWLRGQMGQRLDVMLLKMAGICRGQVERYEKEQIRRRMMDMAERLYPKMEPGEHIKRGKATADTYRYIEKVVRTLRGDMWWRSGAAAAEMEAALQAKLARVDLDPKVREVVERELEELRSKEWQGVEDEIEARERVVDNAEGIYTEEEQAEAGEVIHVLQTYGNWRRMGVEECRKAYEEFRQVVVEGRRKWEAALARRKSELEYVKKKVRAVKGWKSGVVNERVGENAKKASEGKDVVKLTAMALTTFTGKLQAAKRKLGGYFVERETNAIAEMHRELKLKSDEAHNWVLEQLVKCSGERTRAGVEDWLRRMNEIEDTGIKLKLKERHVYSITKEKLGEWARMPREKWAEEIARRQAVAEAEERVDTEIPTVEALEELVPELVNDEVRGGRKQKYVYIWETENETPLRGTKMGVLQAIMTAEQPYYEHLLVDNGVTEEVLAQMREYVGGELLALGYALRDKLAEAREELAAMHERIYGVPFPAHENYYPGKFLVESDNGAQGDGKVAQSHGGLPSRPGSLRTRTIHYRKIDWGASALDTFYVATQQQNNWIVTGDFVAEWADFLNDKGFGGELIGNLGKQWVDLVKHDLRTLANAAVNDINLAALNKAVSVLCRWQAVSKLAFNPVTVAKNATSIFNAWWGGQVPVTEVGQDGTVRAVDAKDVGFLQWLGGMVGEFSYKDIAEQPWIKMREMQKSDRVRKVAGEGASEAGVGTSVRHALSGVEGAAEWGTEVGMSAIYGVDVRGNIISAMMLANAVYRKLEHDTSLAGVSKEEKRRVALQYAEKALDTVAQPVISAQKVSMATSSNMVGALADYTLYLFKSEPMAKLSNAIAQISSGEWRKVVRGCSFFFMSGASAYLFGQGMLYALGVLGQCLSGYDPEPLYEDLEDFWKELLIMGVMQELDVVPFVGNALIAGGRYALGERQWRQDFMGQLIAPYKKLIGGKAKTQAERTYSVCGMLQAAGIAGALSGYARPIASGLELVLLVSGLQNIPAKVAKRYIKQKH